ERMVHAGSERGEEKRSSASLQGGDPRPHEVEKSAICETDAKPLGICREVTLAVKSVETIPCHEWLYSWYVAIQTDDHLCSEPAETLIVRSRYRLSNPCTKINTTLTGSSKRTPTRSLVSFTNGYCG